MQVTVVRITIKKVVSWSTYSYALRPIVAFETQYWLQTSAPFPSQQLREVAFAIARAESRLHPAIVLFTGAVVKLTTPGLSAEELRGQFSTFGLDKMRGQVAMADDDALAFPAVVAEFARNGAGRRGGRLLIPHVLTAAEWSFYCRTRTKPLRFGTQSAPDEAPSSPGLSFSEELLEAIRPHSGTYISPIAPEDAGQTPRVISGFECLGFQVKMNKPKKRKKAVPRRALFGGEAAEIPSPPTTKKLKTPVAGVVYMLQGGQYFKIGKSINPDKRLTQIKLQIPFPVVEVHIIRAANPSEVESYWHRKFAASRQNGEWFLLSDSEVNEFKAVSEM